MKVPVALALVLAIVLREIPAHAAAPDLAEARRRFVAAVHSSDGAVAAAEAALDAAITKAAVLTSADAQRSREAMSRLLTEFRKFKAEKARLLSDLGTYEKLLRAAAGYARACEVLGTVIRVEVAVIVVVVGVVATVATGGAALVVVVAVATAVAAVVVCVTTILASLPEILRALGFRETGDTAERWMRDNPWFGTTVQAISIVATLITTVASATVSLRTADAVARDAQAKTGAAVREVQALMSDLNDAHRAFVAAVQSSDQAVAAAEAALEDLIGKVAVLEAADAGRQREVLAKMLAALRTLNKEKARILARDLGTFEKLAEAAGEYARASLEFARSTAAAIANVAVTVAVYAVATNLVAAQAAVAATVADLAALQASLADITNEMRKLQVDSADQQRQTKDSLDSVKRALEALRAALADLTAAAAQVRMAGGAARDAQARLQALPKPAGPQLPARKQIELAPLPTTFDGDLGGSFHVKLENGQVTWPAGQASLHGTIAITSASNASVKLTLDGSATLTAGGGGGWVSLRGRGTARVSGFGPVLTIPNATVASQGVSVFTLLGDGIPVRGCTHSVEAGSLFSPSRMSFAGSLRCGPWSLSASTLKLEGGGVSGGGTLSAWSKSFTMAYEASGDGLVARGSISGSDTPWTGIPRVDAEYRIERPKLDMKLEGPSLSPTFGAGKVLVRSKATKPDGSPWSSASLTPDVMRVPAPPAGPIPVPFPNLPAPSDVEKAARDACEAGARRTLAGRALQRALDVCRSGHPSPPGVPALPNKLEVPVGEIFR